MAVFSKMIGFEFDRLRTSKTLAMLNALAKGGPRVVAIELNKGVLIWKFEIVRHHPVDSGLARNSWNVELASPNIQGALLFADAGSNVPYVVFLEFGTELIARGKVKAWQPGDAPILDWPAKRGDASEETATSEDEQGRRRNPEGRPVEGPGGDAAEFMPPVRGSWPIVQPQIQANLRASLARVLRTLGKG